MKCKIANFGLISYDADIVFILASSGAKGSALIGCFMVRAAALVIMLMALSTCSELAKQSFVTVKQFDEYVSIVKDENNQLFFQSKPSEVCGYGAYWRESVAGFYVDENIGHIAKSLNELVDIDSLKMTKRIQYQYYFEDKNNTYLLLKTLCDHSVMYKPKQTDALVF